MTYNITDDMIEGEAYICVYCGNDVKPSQLQCCGEHHYSTAYILDQYVTHDIDGQLIDDDYLLESQVNIIEPHELSSREKLDVLGDLQLDIEKGK